LVLAEQLTGAGFGEAIKAALLGEPVLTADESPVEVVSPAKDPGTGETVPGSPHVMVLRTPDERLVWLSALDSRRHDEVIASLQAFTGYLIVDGYLAYQKLLPCTREHDHQEQKQECVGGLLAGLQQCCQHVIRRCRGVAKLGPGGLQSWATTVRTVLSEAHEHADAARTRGESALNPTTLTALRERYDKAVRSGIVHNRHRDWDGGGNHPATPSPPGYASTPNRSGCSPATLLSTGPPTPPNAASNPPNATKPVSGYWQNDQTLARWCLINSYLTTARNHALTILDAITRALNGHPWLPPHHAPA
jgi:hypothetical protein